MKLIYLLLFCSFIVFGCSNKKNNISNEQDKYSHSNTIRNTLDNIPGYVTHQKLIKMR